MVPFFFFWACGPFIIHRANWTRSPRTHSLEAEIQPVTSIGCILPLSGKFEPYGKQALRGIKLAERLFLSNLRNSPLKLIVEDSKGNPKVGKQAVEKLAKKGVVAILGPLGGSEILDAANKAQKLGIPIITLTQRDRITQIGDFVFRNFLTPNAQIEALATYVTQSLGLMNFAILYPDNPYGQKFKTLFQNAVVKNGGIMVAAECYGSHETDFREIIQRLSITPFEAIFIPDDYQKIAIIAPQFTYCDVIDIRFLGTNLWNAQKLVDMAGEHLQGAIFVDGFFKDAPSHTVQHFVENFYLTFWEEPKFLEAHAYDAMCILLGILRNGTIESRKDLRDALYEVRNFDGVTGTTSFTPTGDVEKKPFILTIRGNKIVLLN